MRLATFITIRGTVVPERQKLTTANPSGLYRNEQAHESSRVCQFQIHFIDRLISLFTNPVNKIYYCCISIQILFMSLMEIGKETDRKREIKRSNTIRMPSNTLLINTHNWSAKFNSDYWPRDQSKMVVEFRLYCHLRQCLTVVMKLIKIFEKIDMLC